MKKKNLLAFSSTNKNDNVKYNKWCKVLTQLMQNVVEWTIAN